MHHATTSDRDLVNLVLGGQRDAFTALTERYIAAANAVARARLGRATETEDAVQEAFLRAFERLGTLRDPAKFGPWLLTIARHEAVRLATQRAKSDSLDESANGVVTDSPDVEQREMNALLRDHIMQLPEPSREVLLLHYFAGKSAREIATLLELRRNAVLKRLQRAREQLAETLHKELETSRPSEAAVRRQLTQVGIMVSAAGLPASFTTARALAARLSDPALRFASGTMLLITAVAIVVALMSGQRREISPVVPGAPSNARRFAEAYPLSASVNDQGVDFMVEATSNDDLTTLPSTAASRSTVLLPRWDEWLSLPVTRTISDRHIASVLLRISEQFRGIRFLIDSRAVGLPVFEAAAKPLSTEEVRFPVDGMFAEVKIEALPLSDVLPLICDELGLQYTQHENYVWISTPERLRMDVHENLIQQPPMQHRYLERFVAPVTLVCSTSHLSDLLDRIDDQFDEKPNIVFDSRVVAPVTTLSHPPLPPGKVSDGVMGDFVLRNIPVREHISVVCRLTNTIATIYGDYVWITSPAFATGRRLGPAPVSPDGIDMKLERLVEAAYSRKHLSDVAAGLSQMAQVTIVADQHVVIWDGEPIAAKPLPGMRRPFGGSLSHGMIHRLDVVDVQVKSFLDILMKLLDLEYETRENFFVITSKSALELGPPDETDLLPAEQFIEALPRNRESPNQRGRLRLVRIYKSESSDYLAEFEDGMFTSSFREGSRMADYTLQLIDPESGCVTLLDPRTAEESNLCLVQDDD